jgi:DNA-binding NarL/FixJ family response regulator
MPIRILLADDHMIMRQGLRQILEHEADFVIVAEAGSGLEAIEQAQEHQPDVAVVDIAMKELNGIEATAQILRRAPNTKVLILSMYSDERYVISAVKAGARGYVLKNSAGDELIQAVREVRRGATFFSPAVAKVFRNGYSDLQLGHSHLHLKDAEDPFESLTERERQVYQMLAEGNCNKDIANRLDLSLHTVETHRWRIMEKMNLHSMAELVLSAVRRGMVS